MKKLFDFYRKNKGDRGIAAVYVAILILVLLGIAALAVDIGYLMVSRNELQNAADASALAATRQLGVIYEPMPYEVQQNYICNPDNLIIIQAAQNIASSNRAAGETVRVLAEDVVIGDWNASTKVLTPTLNQPDAVRVTTRRDSTVEGGPVRTFFARILNILNVPVTATATAALTGESTVAEGGLPLPLGIPRRWFEQPDFCGSSINFYPPCNREPCETSEGCAGYHTYTRMPASASYLANTIMPGIWQGTYDSPETTAYETRYEFTGGTLANLMNPPDYPFVTLFHQMRDRGPSEDDADDDPNTWTTKVVVYDSDTCANPNQSQLVIGFATIRITNVVGSPNPTVQGQVMCDFVDAGRGSGGNYGTRGSIPGLVQ